MRMSCNGCRVLRKGCSENCSIRPCLQWIKTPESQANATVFLAKFYGRAGLMNLINSGPQHLRPAIFRSLLYEACGRIVNPIYGSVGLLWSGSWQLCQAAVEAVLKGAPIMQISSEVAAGSSTPPLKAYDIRHASKDDNSSAASQDLHKVRTRNRFKRTTAKPKSINNNNKNKKKMCGGESAGGADQAGDDDDDSAAQVWPLSLERAPSHESSLSHQTTEMNGGGESDSMFSVETVEASLMSRAEPEPVPKFDQDCYQVGLGLDLTLGLEPCVHSANRVKRVVGPSDEMNGSDVETCKMELGFDYSA